MMKRVADASDLVLNLLGWGVAGGFVAFAGLFFTGSLLWPLLRNLRIRDRLELFFMAYLGRHFEVTEACLLALAIILLGAIIGIGFGWRRRLERA